MTNQIDHIVKHLFSKRSLDEVSESELKNFVDTHPYFAAGHLLLAKKMQVGGSEQTQQNIATTALYYNNALWLQWLLDQDLSNKTQEYKPVVHTNGLETVRGTQNEEEETVIAPEHSSADAVAETTHTAIEESGEFNDASYSPAKNINEVNVSDEDSIELSALPPAEEESVKDEMDQPLTFSPALETSPNETSNQIDEINTEEQFIATDVEPDAIKQPNMASVDILPESDQVKSDKHVAEAEKTEVISAEEHTVEQSLDDEDNKSAYAEADMKDEAESRASAASIGKTLSSAALIPTKAEIEKNDLTFEPYHTIDYFASQGIKLQQSDLSKDKFGKQLKSFTEWLRSMKRLPQASAEGSIDEATQRSIQQVAEHSIEEKDIVTETMAEVWIKQGNKEKAIDTLHKLSLLNPSKSHYFAAKIEQLKAS